MSGPGPRNRAAFERGQRLRAEVRAILEAHPPLLPPLTAPAIRARLTCSPRPSVRTVRWHVSRIRLQAELAVLAGEASAQ